MNEELTPNILLKILKDCGFETTKASIARYAQDGLVMRPLQKRFRRDVAERAYYHPLAIIEIMTAILLFRGDFLEYKSTKRIARLTDRDLLYGRIAFYANSDVSPLKNLSYNRTDEYYTSIDRYPYKNFSDQNKLPMQMNLLKEYHSYISRNFNEELFFESNYEFEEIYKVFSAEIYTTTFCYLLNKYRNILDTLYLK